MGRRLRPLALATLIGSAVGANVLRAQEASQPDSAAKADTVAKPADEAVGLKLGSLPLYLTGYVTSTFTYSFAATGNQLVGRFYNRYQKQFMANGLELGLTKPVDTGKLDAGAHAELLFGQDAAVTQSQGLSLGPNGDLTEAYVTLNVPTGGADHWVQFKLGKMWTIMGYEVIDDVLDPNLDVGNQFVYLENFTNTGLGVDFKFGAKVDAQLRIINGWDVVVDNNSALSFMGRLGFTPNSNVTIGLLGYVGAEQPDNNSNLRYGFEVLGTFKLGSKASVVGQFDYGEEEGLLPDPDQKAKWWGAGLWFVRDLSSTLNLALRGDYVDDSNGVRTSGVLGYAAADARKYGSVTATLNIHVFLKATIRPEFRVDFSSLDDYGELTDPKSTQPSIGIGATYQF
jgi:hypothetical protein